MNRAKANNYTGYSFISVLFVSNQPTNIHVGSYSMGGNMALESKSTDIIIIGENASSHLPVSLPQIFKTDLMMLCTTLRRRADCWCASVQHSHVYIVLFKTFIEYLIRFLVFTSSML